MTKNEEINYLTSKLNILLGQEPMKIHGEYNEGTFYMHRVEHLYILKRAKKEGFKAVSELYTAKEMLAFLKTFTKIIEEEF